MTTEAQIAKRAQLKQAKLVLAKKYERLAKVAKSKPKRQKFLHKAEQYRRQVEQLSLK